MDLIYLATQRFGVSATLCVLILAQRQCRRKRI
jgi:hypothetical protein